MNKNVVALVLAGGKGTRLEFLTKKIAKPAVSFAGKYRIIDFPLSNCANSGITAVGVLTQYESTLLDGYIGNGEKWGLNGVRSVISVLNPRQTEEGANWYKGTADAITQNIDWIDSVNPEYVLILSGDHVYKTTYNDMIQLHIDSGADATISVMEVPFEEASRFGIMNVDENDVIVEFEEKPKKPKSNLASMGVYVFSWKVLRKYLLKDNKDENSAHDFGKNIIPAMLAKKLKLQAYRYVGYWKDVGTISSLHEANMDVIEKGEEIGIYSNNDGIIYSEDTHSVPHYIGKRAKISNSIVNQGAIILGNIDHCVVSSDVLVSSDSKLTNCVVMSGSQIGAKAVIHNAIIAPNTIIDEGREINVKGDEIVLISK